ncbi:MAG: SDR family oxidoreductase [Chloroflexota bacterium]
MRKTAWITGASSGIGAAIASALEPEYNLALSARSFENNFVEGRLELKMDLRNVAAIYEGYDEIFRRFGAPDVLVNNAGVGAFKPLEELSLAEFDEIIDVNLRGAFLCIKKVLPDMLERGSGIILNILTSAIKKSYQGNSVYSASKAALHAMSGSLREETRKRGVKIIDVLPGATATNIWSKEDLDEYRHKMMSAEEIGTAVKSLLNLHESGNLLVEEIIINPKLGAV